MADWKFGRRRPECGCGKVFADGEPHYSMLSIEEGELVRADSCRPCWDERGPAPEDLVWWRTRHEENKKRGLQLNLEALEALFLSLEGREELGLRELRYVLSLLLLRKRRLKVVRIRRGKQGESMILRRPRRKEELEVFVFDFDADRLEVVRQKLMGLFDGSDPDLDRLADDPTPEVAEDGSEEPDAEAAKSEVGEDGAAAPAEEGGEDSAAPEHAESSGDAPEEADSADAESRATAGS